MMMSGRMIFVFASVVALSLFPEVAHGASFRGGNADTLHSEKDLLQDLEKFAGRDHRLATEARVDRLENALRPMFAAMPKDSAGLLNSAGVRYVLHRLFVQRHGWFVEGLDNNGDAWHSSSPAEVFMTHAGDHHAHFDDMLKNQGFTLHQVAVFAATLETLVHAENQERLGVTYRLQGLSKSEQLSDAEAAEAIRGYMVVLVRLPQGTNMSAVTRRQYQYHDRIAAETYPTWPDTEQFAHGIRQRIIEDVQSDDQNTWETNLKIVEEIGERYGRWQSKECHVLKNMLVEMEQPGSGRVRLEDFYGPALTNKTWQFVESVPYLRQLGALDESDPQRPSVIIPNYLGAPTNCVAGSKFYSVCCIDECEDLLGSLETQIAAPEATPARIADIVSKLASDTQAPRAIPAALMDRLQDIASHHGGTVPLHGRLFAQWMHHVYPRECPYPHVSGTTNPQTQEEWLAKSDHPIEANMADIENLVSLKVADQPLEHQALPWHAEEELFVQRPKLPAARNGKTINFLQCLFLVGLIFGAYMLRQPNSSKGKGGILPTARDHKYYV